MKALEQTLWTIGHSTRALDELVELLREHEIELLVDVRSFPRSRRNPQFNLESLAQGLPERGIAYEHMKALGGHRRPRPDSINTAWRVEGFRGYADYMQTAEFEMALRDLIDRARRSRTAIMCAEAVPWRCHRRLIADALLARGWNVYNITSPSDARPHALPDFARVAGDRVTYPADPLFVL